MHPADVIPDASRPVLRRRLVGLRLAVVLMCWLAPWTARSFAAAPRPATNVVLVHGFWNTGKVFDPLVTTLEQHGCRCYAPSLQPNDFRDGVRALSLQLSRGIDARFGPHAPFVLIGFSMGGLVARDYVQNLGGSGRVQAFFMISTANRGTVWAATSPRPGVRELAPGSTFLRTLNADLSAWRGIPGRAYWTPLDYIVFPATNCLCPWGGNQAVFCLLHRRMVRNPAVMADIAARIDALRG